MENMKQSAPWITLVHELHALFDEDPEVHVKYVDGAHEVTLYVDDQDKADALTELIGESKTYGNVVMKINIVPANAFEDKAPSVVARAFKGNPVMKRIQHVESRGLKIDYAVFRKEVVQFFNDNLQDPHGNKSTLYEDIARDVFEETGVCFCTDNEGSVGKPLGEWP